MKSYNHIKELSIFLAIGVTFATIRLAGKLESDRVIERWTLDWLLDMQLPSE